MKNIIKLFVIAIVTSSLAGCFPMYHDGKNPKQPDQEQYYPILNGGK
jgi:predicted small lipoprotein YifL